MASIRAEHLLTRDRGEIPGGVLEFDGERIAAIRDSGRADEEVDGWLVPGFVDTHCHGGFGFAFSDPERRNVMRAIEYHRTHGSTTLFASTVSEDEAVLSEQVDRLADLCDEGELDGIHLEGPCLAVARRGAHNAELLRDPDPHLLGPLLGAGRGHVRMVTLAPERRGALEGTRRLVGEGVVVAFGHSAADAELTRRHVDAGARVATHLFNAMTPIRHRDPGAVPILLNDDRVLVELICDGVHVAPEVVTMAIRAAGPGRAALVTDAMSAAGMPDGRFVLGTLPVIVQDEVARIDDGTETGPIAGSTLSMDRAFWFLVRVCGLTIPHASACASTNAAAWHGLTDVGSLAPGLFADACLVDDEGTLRQVLRRGAWV